MLDTLKANIYHDTLALIAYNHSFPDTTIRILRERYYTPLVDPQLIVDGMKVQNNDSATYTSSINAARQYSPSLNLYLEARATTDSGSMTFKIVNVDSTLAFDSVFALVAVCQDSVEGLLKHGFNYVCRYLFEFPISIAYADSFDTTINFTNVYPVEKLHAVAFIQDLGSSSVDYLKVYQAVTVPFNTFEQ